MKPHSLTKSRGTGPALPLINAEWIARHGVYPKGTVLPETQVEHCPKRRVADFPKGFISPRLYEKALEHNQTLPSCCRHPENHKIKAKKSHPREPRPDIYIFYCTCGSKHRVMCVGMGDERPEWK
jgi:hypothetical protein